MTIPHSWGGVLLETYEKGQIVTMYWGGNCEQNHTQSASSFVCKVAVFIATVVARLQSSGEGDRNRSSQNATITPLLPGFSFSWVNTPQIVGNLCLISRFKISFWQFLSVFLLILRRNRFMKLHYSGSPRSPVFLTAQLSPTTWSLW